jgi:hypothetical protein
MILMARRGRLRLTGARVTCQLRPPFVVRSTEKYVPSLWKEQVAYEVRRAIANGEAKPGERIPKVKDLAAILGVNANTVLRALRTLQDEACSSFDAAAESPWRARLIAVP